jgi:hypothetical protein
MTNSSETGELGVLGYQPRLRGLGRNSYTLHEVIQWADQAHRSSHDVFGMQHVRCMPQTEVVSSETRKQWPHVH